LGFRGVVWFVTDVAGQYIPAIFRGQYFRQEAGSLCLGWKHCSLTSWPWSRDRYTFPNCRRNNDPTKRKI